MTLPPPSATQAYCDVSALEAGLIHLPLMLFTSSITDPGVISLLPSLSFLLQHSTNTEKFVFDLGIRCDWENYPPTVFESIKKVCETQVPQDVVESLAKGRLSPSDVSTPDSWQPLGPFPRALDFYGDGSLYIVDAAGYLEGHINVLARTSADGAWIYLAGDSAHHWDLIMGKGNIPHHAIYGYAQHIRRIRALRELPRVRVLLAHDGPWYESIKGGPAFWPGKIVSL
ncbi:hypothetical protein L208DRAFT_1407921 [Tricholoma matsutake]|nr:hypothetical protein L208DRAFT_1407921 [Tricholoma matsutake 945]